MCLGVPGRIVDVNGLVATVDFWGVRRQVRLDLVDAPVARGDYILNHVGFAIRRIPEDEIEGTLELYEELLRAADSDDLMTADVQGELNAGAAALETGAALEADERTAAALEADEPAGATRDADEPARATPHVAPPGGRK